MQKKANNPSENSSLKQTIEELQRFLETKNTKIAEQSRLLDESKLQASRITADADQLSRSRERSENEATIQMSEARQDFEGQKRINDDLVKDLRAMLECEKRKLSDQSGEGKRLCEDILRVAYPDVMDQSDVVPAHLTLKRIVNAFGVRIELPDFEDSESAATGTAEALEPRGDLFEELRTKQCRNENVYPRLVRKQKGERAAER